MKLRFWLLYFILGFSLFCETTAANAQEKYFNNYILRAVQYLAQNRSGLGYGGAAYTSDLRFGEHVLRATNPPYTMCVAAQVEIIAKAFEIYYAETKDNRPFNFLPIEQWRLLSPHSLRGKIWRVHASMSSGTADALENFGMGEQIRFDKLSPGAFINFSRDVGTGHAAVFLHYIDSQGRLLKKYRSDVDIIGFEYFSAQGNSSDGGFGFRLAFFSDYGCPQVLSSTKRDCGVIYSPSSKKLNTGQMLHPKFWNSQQAESAISLFQISRSANPQSIMDEAFDLKYFSGKTTDD